MKNIVVTFILTFILMGCKNEKVVLEEETMGNYYQIDSTIIQDGGIKMIPITTKDTVFHVWTKRIGNNPKTKVLLLNGGPGCTHEYFECFETLRYEKGLTNVSKIFYLRKELSLFITIS